jgi:hypothetical protein
MTSPEEHMQHDGNDNSSHDLNFLRLEQEFMAKVMAQILDR